MFEHGLDVPKGWFQPAALDKSAKLSANVTFDLPAGRVVHLNSAGEFETGVGQTDMAIFLLQASNDFDVANPGTTASGLFMQQAIAPTGVMSGLVATGGYEIQSTEFDATQSYVTGDLLTATVANTTLATGGVLTNVGTGVNGDVQQFVDPVCGVVADGAFRNSHGVYVLDFWPVWLPGAYA
jgi:hypothetical protein